MIARLFHPVKTKAFTTGKLLVLSLGSLGWGIANGLPGIRFDLFGRYLAIRSIILGQRGNLVYWQGLNPVSSIRYFEFDFARRCINDCTHQSSILDISSPRLWPFWLGHTRKKKVMMINPDGADLRITKQFVGTKNLSHPLLSADAVNLPFPDNSFDIISAISVIEHIYGNGDGQTITEFARILRPGGRMILTFPVLPAYYEEYRSYNFYGAQKYDSGVDQYFFQRFYDQETIHSRILQSGLFAVRKMEYYWESPAGWFNQYIQNWQKQGEAFTVKDPFFMANHFVGPKATHPKDRMGNCHLFLEVL